MWNNLDAKSILLVYFSSCQQIFDNKKRLSERTKKGREKKNFLLLYSEKSLTPRQGLSFLSYYRSLIKGNLSSIAST